LVPYWDILAIEPYGSRPPPELELRYLNRDTMPNFIAARRPTSNLQRFKSIDNMLEEAHLSPGEMAEIIASYIRDQVEKAFLVGLRAGRGGDNQDGVASAQRAGITDPDALVRIYIRDEGYI